MVMVEKIQKLEHPGTLRNFRWPANMLSFGHYNLISGWTGSGKTTISRLFQLLEMGMSQMNRIFLVAACLLVPTQGGISF